MRIRHPKSEWLLVILALTLAAYTVGRWHRESKLAKEEANTRVRFILATQAAKCGLMECDPSTGRIITADHITCLLFGYSAGELNGRLVNDLIPLGTEERHSNKMKEAMDRVVKDPTAPRVLVTVCDGRSRNGVVEPYVVRAFMDPTKETVFATVNKSKDVIFHSYSPPSASRPVSANTLATP